MMSSTPIATGPLIALHRKAGATINVVEGWEVATKYSAEPTHGANAIVDLTGRTVSEINGRQTQDVLTSICGSDVAIRSVISVADQDVYRLTDMRAIVLGPQLVDQGINVTGGWASIGLFGPDIREILQKITAIDLRDSYLGVGRCAQGPVFGVNVLFGRLADHYELHACPDMTQFLWEVLLDAGDEFELKPAGRKWVEVTK